MYLSIGIILYLLLMAVVWSAQGLFSAVLQLLVVLLAGTLAFAFWEPIAVGLLMPFVPHLAWGLALLVPFALLVVGIRVLLDTLVPGNLRLPSLVNSILGAAFGAMSGALTAGIAVIGIGFLPLGPSLLGHQPYAINGDGSIAPIADLWVPVDQYADTTFQILSAGAMSSGSPMSLYQPDLREQSNLYRMRYDENASLVIGPDALEIERMVVSPLPVDGLPLPVTGALPQITEANAGQLVLIDLKVTKGTGAFDRDATFRLPPTQIRLLAGPRDGTEAQAIAPVAFSRLTNPSTGQRTLYPVDDDRISADSAQPEQNLTWAFVIPERDAPRYLMVRNLRLNLPSGDEGVAAMAGLMGLPEAEVPEEGLSPTQPNPNMAAASDREGVRAGHVADIAELTNRLPRGISRNAAAGLSLRPDGDDTVIVSGEASINRPTVSLSARTRVDGFFQPGHMAMIRVLLEADQARSTFGRARAAAAALQGVWLQDDRGNLYQPFAYTLLKENGTQIIRADPELVIRSATELPIQQMSDEDELYLYFLVPKGTQILTYHIGNSTTQDLVLLAE
ncbi:hypothetical protein [Mucisphaera sp.]|uniref:hypothetical protein n=1 Tax=Mucisphaera sp. TaxID=2913024 RepID=UPI003D0CDC42